MRRADDASQGDIVTARGAVVLTLWIVWFFMPIWSRLQSDADGVISAWMRLLLIVLVVSLLALVMHMVEGP